MTDCLIDSFIFVFFPLNCIFALSGRFFFFLFCFMFSVFMCVRASTRFHVWLYSMCARTAVDRFADALIVSYHS